MIPLWIGHALAVLDVAVAVTRLASRFLGR